MSILLSELIKEVQLGDSINANIEVVDIQIDSRLVTPGSLFIALKGNDLDGHRFINDAIRLGAIAIVCEQDPVVEHDDVTVILVKDSHEAAGKLASVFYGNPSTKLKLIGVTGTNGKTTTATLLHDQMTSLGYRSGLLSTIENRIIDQVQKSNLTTPDPISLNRMLRAMVEVGCEFAFMEVSSHAVDQKRIAGLVFSGAIFTNLTRDHLDYHGSMDAYLKAKQKFFDGLTDKAFALVNADEKHAMIMVQNTKAKVYTYSIQKSADFQGRVLENTLSGLVMRIDGEEVHFRLLGLFNAYNLMCAYGVSRLLGFPQAESLVSLSVLQSARGRFEVIRHPHSETIFIVDYAHTPDSLEKVLENISKMKSKHSKIITVVGCGGDRDQGKRPMMGQTAARWSDEVVFTSDNPRKEDPEVIIDQMYRGVNEEDRGKISRITDRKQAILVASKLAKNSDIVLVAGKGHETVQSINGQNFEFDDRKVIEDMWK